MCQHCLRCVVARLARPFFSPCHALLLFLFSLFFVFFLLRVGEGVGVGVGVEGGGGGVPRASIKRVERGFLATPIDRQRGYVY